MPLCSVLLALAAFALLQAIEVRQGFFDVVGLMWLSLAFILSICAISTFPRGGETLWKGLSSTRNRHSRAVQAATLLLPETALTRLLQAALGVELIKLAVQQPQLRVALGIVALLTLFEPSSARMPLLFKCYQRGRVPLLLGAYALLALSLILPDSPPHKFADFYLFQRDASAALLHGANPYAITFPNIYGDNSPFYGPGLSVGGRLQFGYVYMPLTLLMALPGYLLGDLRFSHLASVALAAALIAALRPGRISFLAAALLLFTPTNLFVVKMGWVENFVVLTLAATLFCVLRRPRFLPLALGLLLASKQYIVLALPLMLLLWPRSAWRDQARKSLVRASGWALLVTLPLALWDAAAFWKSVVALQTRQPFRDDSLSYLALLKHAGFEPPSALIAFALLPPLMFWMLRRLAPSLAPADAARRARVGADVTQSDVTQSDAPAAFAAALGLLFLFFFAFNKQAFVNYYFFVLFAFGAAIAATRTREITPAAETVQVSPANCEMETMEAQVARS